jgi:hypothetical protein
MYGHSCLHQSHHSLLHTGNAHLYQPPPGSFFNSTCTTLLPPTCPIQRCPTTMQVQGSSRPDALKFQAAQPPAVTQGPGNHRLEHGQWTRVRLSSLGNTVGQRCVSPICLFCAPSTRDVGGWFWFSLRVHEGVTRRRRGRPDAGSTDTRHVLVVGTRGWVREGPAGCETARRGSVGMDENGRRKGV